MYFQDPRTLLQIYAQLEEQNLFLIQNAQESEEALEELRAKFRSASYALQCCCHRPVLTVCSSAKAHNHSPQKWGSKWGAPTC